MKNKIKIILFWLAMTSISVAGLVLYQNQLSKTNNQVLLASVNNNNDNNLTNINTGAIATSSIQVNNPVNTAKKPTSSTGTVVPTTKPSTKPITQPVVTPPANNPPVVTTPPVVSPTPSNTVSGATATEVATHNSANSCWMIIDNKVYDLTSYINLHPGGKRTILDYCGRDGTSAFRGHSSYAWQLLSGFFQVNLK